jgi:hypothetical protein
MTLIQEFSDGSQVFFDKGAFDNWCVYFQKPDLQKAAPTDMHYFTRFQALANIYGASKIYQDFVSFYEQTTKNIDKAVLNLIHKLSTTYHSHSLTMEILFTIVYAGMIAEENKEFAILKKRIKRLGMHQILIEQLEPKVAAHFSKGKKWKELYEICKAKGF